MKVLKYHCSEKQPCFGQGALCAHECEWSSADHKRRTIMGSYAYRK